MGGTVFHLPIADRIRGESALGRQNQKHHKQGQSFHANHLATNAAGAGCR